MANDDKGTLHKPLTDLKHLNFVLRHQILFLPALWILFSVYGVGYIFISTTAIVLTTPIVLHLIYPTLFYQSIIADLQKPMGISLVFCASVVAVLLQPGPRARESAAFLRVMVLIEFLHNGSPTEKEQVTSYLRWIKRAGLSDERTAEMIEIVTWILLGFEERFGYKMSPRRKDALVMQSRCSGLRIGVPVDLLATDYDSLNARFSSLPGLQDIARRDELVLRASSASSFFVKFASLIALDLLPGNLSGSIRTSLSRLFGSKVLLWGFNSFMWLIYPLLAWIPLRTIIGLVTFTHSKSRLAINSIMDDVFSMDITQNLPTLPPAGDEGHPSYISWLEDEIQEVTFFNAVLRLALTTQTQSSFFNIFSWLTFSLSIVKLVFRHSLDALIQCFELQAILRMENFMFNMKGVKMPQHVGLIMDGNRRYAKQLDRPVLFGHIRGARKAADVRAYWMQTAADIIDHRPQAMTVWAFSSDNHKRNIDEVRGLFRILEAEFMDMAYCPLIHLCHIRVRIIGSKERLPPALLRAIEILESATEHHSQFFYQIAVGYGGKLEVVEAVNEITAKGEKVSERAIEEHTICAKIGVPPVDFIVRTSEHRTSGFFLWGTQNAELHFIDKLWPLLTAKDWCASLLEFGAREIRNGL